MVILAHIENTLFVKFKELNIEVDKKNKLAEEHLTAELTTLRREITKQNKALLITFEEINKGVKKELEKHLINHQKAHEVLIDTPNKEE